HSIAGSLRMVPLPAVAEILHIAAPFIEQLIESGARSDWTTLDHFADVLSGVEYFIERYTDNPRNPGDDILQRVWESLESITDIQAPNRSADVADTATGDASLDATDPETDLDMASGAEKPLA
ncbi:hypothetical protein Q4595_21670, partial [Wenyingzhuangia sp. 1_MG-2023]|nr:hypothetical protein [Wenyingzhuangia sp. 1_MG-2023]